MGLNDTPSANRVHIGFFGRRNAGKSSLVNAITAQELSVVSDYAGTTTDPVKKAMELLPLGPVMIIDTPGFDDVGELGNMRVKQTKKVLETADIAVLVCDAQSDLQTCENQLLQLFRENNTPYIVVYNKCDLLSEIPADTETAIYVSALEKVNIEALKEKMAHLIGKKENKTDILGDIVKPGETAILVTPIDEAAPKGRLILPQQQVIRDILDSNAAAVVVKENMLEAALSFMKVKPAVVITDSQAFGKVSKIVPKDIKLTSFSILMANFKGMLKTAVSGAASIDRLRDGDKVLISEGCSHHRQCGDIGSVKIPAWLRKHTGKKLDIHLSSGKDFPESLNEYALVIHCGGCMLTEKEVEVRIRRAERAGVPFTNYGIAIAHMNGILRRSLEVFPEISALLEVSSEEKTAVRL